MFDVEKFQALRKGNFGTELYFFDEIDSTNRVAADLARQDVKEGAVVLAESQNQGRGRNNHAWYSPAGVNLYFTVILYPPVHRLHYLPFIIGLSIVETLDLFGLHSDLKWPNDVLIDGRKISGVLIQTSVEENRLQYVLAGVGINLNARAFPEELESIAISVLQSSGREVEREEFLARLLLSLEQLYEKSFTITWAELTEKVMRNSTFFEGCDVQIEQEGRITIGRTAGLDAMGGLIVKTADGEQVFYSGEIQSCRKK